MAAFDYVILLASFVYGLALAHLLSRLNSLLFARNRVRFSGLQTLMMVNAMLTVFVDWVSAWLDHDVKEWDLLTVALWFVFSLLIFFLCAAAAPETPPAGDVDLNDFYWSHRRVFWVTYAMLQAVGMASSVALLNSPNRTLFAPYALSSFPFFIPPALAILVRARWAQWVSGVGVFVMSIVWAIVFVGVLR